MGYTSITVATRSWPSVRRHLTTGVTIASAGILTLGLVVVPPDSNARTEVRAVQLTAWTLPTAADGWGALLREFIGNQTNLLVPAGGNADVPAAAVDTPTPDARAQLTADSLTDPAVSPEKADAAALAATTTALPIPPIPAPLLPIIGPILLFGPIILLVILACPPCALFNFLSYIPAFFGIYLPVLPLAAAAATETVEPTATVAPTLTSDLPSQATETEKADVSATVTSDDKRAGAERGTSTEPAAGDEQTPTEAAKEATETDGAEQASTEQPTASDGESPVDVTEPRKPVERPETPRPVVRDSLGADKKTSDTSHRGNGGRATTEEPAGGRAATAGSSSADSSSTDSATSGGRSSESNTGGSE